MVYDKIASIDTTVTRILRERLEPFGVPLEIRNEIKEEILTFLQRPEKKLYGATVMTPEASMAADKARQRGKADKNDAKPQVM